MKVAQAFFDEAKLVKWLGKIDEKIDGEGDVKVPVLKSNTPLCHGARTRLRALFEVLKKSSDHEKSRVAHEFSSTVNDFLGFLRAQNHYNFLLYWLATSQSLVSLVKCVHQQVSRIYKSLGLQPDMIEAEWVALLDDGRRQQEVWLKDAIERSSDSMLVNEKPNPLKVNETLVTMDNQLLLRENVGSAAQQMEDGIDAMFATMRSEMAHLMRTTRDRVRAFKELKQGREFEWFIAEENITCESKSIGVEGSYGKVYRAVWRDEMTNEKKVVAVKTLINMHNLEDNRKLSREIDAWVKLDDKHVLQMIGANYSYKTKYLVMEFATEGNLEYFFRDVDDRGNRKLLWSFFRQAAEGLRALHNCNPPVEHGGLNTTNLLLTKEDDELVVKISDFGMSVIRAEAVSVSTHSKRAMVRWRAPERLENAPDGVDFSKADIYGLGLCVIDAASGEPPFPDSIDQAVVESKLSREHVPRPKQGLSDEEWAFVDSMCDPNPDARPDLDFVIDRMVELDGIRQANWPRGFAAAG